MRRIILAIFGKFKTMSEKAYRELFDSATSQGFKANVLKPLISVIIILLVADFAFLYFGFIAVGITFVVTTLIIIVVMVACYVFCLYTNPDYLRSEKYNLEKTAIEKTAMIGDTTIRVIPPSTDYTVMEVKGSNEAK